MGGNLRVEEGNVMTKFYFDYGGFQGGAIWVEMLEDGTLQHVIRRGLPVFTPISPFPSSEAWAEFWRTCKDIGVSKWEAKYEPERPFATDGVNWKVDIETDELTLKSKGYNVTPPNFHLFCGALKKLIGGLFILGLEKEHPSISELEGVEEE